MSERGVREDHATYLDDAGHNKNSHMKAQRRYLTRVGFPPTNVSALNCKCFPQTITTSREAHHAPWTVSRGVEDVTVADGVDDITGTLLPVGETCGAA